MDERTNGQGERAGEARVRLEARPEGRLVRRDGSGRHVDFCIRVGEAPVRSGERPPLVLGLVLDRSGSMSGDKIATAKRAALAVLERLRPRDRVALVVFDDRIDVLQRAAPATEETRARIRAALAKVDARGTTALHEGWLTGCREIAADSALSRGELARCFLLTDGLANVGLTDPAAIATEAAGIREHAGISTSTFGIGPDYAEELLGPMAVAGGGQFHHLRTAEEIASTFQGELGGLLAVAAARVRLELEVSTGVQVALISQYWARSEAEGRRWSVEVGDLMAEEERHVVARLDFPPADGRAEHAARARLVWWVEGQERASDWQEVGFAYADSAACEAEPHDADVMRWVGLHQVERARREATQRSKRGDRAGARQTLRAVQDAIQSYASADAVLRSALGELQALERQVAEQRMSSMAAKEQWYLAQRRSRGQAEWRGGSEVGHLLRRFLRVPAGWPTPLRSRPEAERLRDLYRGCLLWGAVGDALGRAVEGWTPEQIRARFGPDGLREFVPWSGYRGGPRGTITDDTQLTMEVARSLVAMGGRFDAEDFARRLAAWLPHGRGVGHATRVAVELMAQGTPWWEAGAQVDSAGNGAAMRAAPIGLVWALAASSEELRRDAVLSALPTHTHPVGVAAAVLVATGVAWCIRERASGADRLDVPAFLACVRAAIEGMEPEPTQERRPGAGRVRLSERVGELELLVRRDRPEEVFAYTYNGGFALESVPAALYCFLRSPDDPREVVLTAVNAGYDADTVASMAGNLAGAWCGAERLRREAGDWWQELESRQELERLADELLRVAEGNSG